MKKLFLFSILIISCIGVNAQYITIDKDGYTNIRKYPNAKSEIVGTVVQYEQFFAASYICDSDYQDTLTNWLLITKDIQNPIGYVYKKNLLQIENLPFIEGIKTEKNQTKILTCANDSLQVIMTLCPFEMSNHEITNPRLNDDGQIIGFDKINGGYPFGSDGYIPNYEIQEVKIILNGKTILLPRNGFNIYFNVNYLTTYLGVGGELYIQLSGGDGASGYRISLSVANGKLLYVRDCDACK